MPIDSRRVQQIFLAAIGASDRAARETILSRECAADEELRRRVAALLTHHDENGGFLDRPALDTDLLLDCLPMSGASAMPAPAPNRVADGQAGAMIDCYRLIEPIGEGGMGTVWLAEQLTPVRRQVALKLMRPDVTFLSALARSEGERQALALMDHPHIAKVLDAGMTSDDCPYLVMELVEGIPVTDFCDDKQFTVRQRLELFVEICDAVQHAHHKGIIHRDIKPTNILVGEPDGKPLIKVIDFGLAKALEGRPALTEQSIYTLAGTMIGSPPYMAPEQIGGHQPGLDTRSDVYSLGVLLYELITGTTPIERRRFRDTPWDEVYRLIREEEAPRPSSRILTAARRNDLAAARRCDPKQLSKLLAGELDWIALKALEKDPARRYSAARELAADVRRYLAHEPVSARSATRLYRLQKFARRNRIACAAAAAVLAALVGGLAVSTWLLVQEKAAYQRAVSAEREQMALRTQAEVASHNEVALRQQAEANAARTQTETLRSQKVAEFMKDMLKGVGPRVALNRDTQLLREMMDQTAGHLKDLHDQPVVEADLRTTLGNVYADLGEYARAEEMHQAALAIREVLPGDNRADRARSLNDLAEVYYGQGRYTEAEAMHRKALAIRRELFGNDDLSVAESLTNLGESIRRQRRPQKYADAEAMLREALAIRRKLLGNENVEVATSLSNLGLILWHEAILGRVSYAEAEAAHREALEMRRRLLGPAHPDIAVSLDRLGLTLHWEGRYAEAEVIHREGLAMRRQLLGSDHPELAHSLLNLANTLQHQNKLTEVEALLREALAIRRKVLPADHYDLNATIDMLAWFLLTGPDAQTRDPQEALGLAKELIGQVPDNPSYLNTIAAAYYRAGDYETARTELEKSISLRRSAAGSSFDGVFMAMTCWKLGQQEEALRWYKKIEHRTEPQPRNQFVLLRLRQEAAALLGVSEDSPPP